MTSLEPLITFRIVFTIFSDSCQEYHFLGSQCWLGLVGLSLPFPRQIFDEVSPPYLTTSLHIWCSPVARGNHTWHGQWVWVTLAHIPPNCSRIMTTNCLSSILGSVSNYECSRDWSNVSFVSSGLNTNKVVILRLSWYFLLWVNIETCRQ